MTPRTLLGLAGSLIAVAVLAPRLGAQAPPAQPAAPAFKGPILAITVMSDSGDLLLLEKVETTALGDRKFLVGMGVADEKTPDWRNGKRIWLAIDDVQQVVEFATLEDFHKAVELKGEEAVTKSASISRVRGGPAVRF
jgi:hypothetical protein